MKRVLCVAAFVALAQGVGAQGVSAGSCVTRDEMTALRVAALQQQLMVAALTCHDEDDYNNFVTSYRPALQRSDRAMLDLFVSKEGESGDADYNAYKTRLANLASMRSIRHGGRFCREAEERFDLALNNDRSLSELVWSQPISARMPFESCEDEPMLADASPPAHHRHIHWRSW